jgi:hypothetical protein
MFAEPWRRPPQSWRSSSRGSIPPRRGIPSSGRVSHAVWHWPGARAALSDMFVLPHVVLFDSVAHFFELYRTVDLFAISHRMRRPARRPPARRMLGYSEYPVSFKGRPAPLRLVPSLPPARPPLPPQAGLEYSQCPLLAHPLGSILKYTVNPTGRREGSSGALAHAQAFLVRQAHRPRAVRVRRHRRREGSFVSPLSSVRSVFCVLLFRTSLSCLLAFSPSRPPCLSLAS